MGSWDSKKMMRTFEAYEKQEFEFSKGMSRAEDLERKLGSASWYRFYRWPEAGMIKCVCLVDYISEGSESIRPHANGLVTPEEADLIAAVSAFWSMQNSRRRQFLESQMSIHNQKEFT
jgi:hypothetical protein